MEPAIQTKSTKSFFFWVAVAGVPIWATTFLILWWRYASDPSYPRPVLVIFAMAAAVCVGLILSYLLLPHRRGPYAAHLAGAALGGLTAMSLTEPVFLPLVIFQMHLILHAMHAIDFPLTRQWIHAMSRYGAWIEIVVIGMAAGWIFVVIASRLQAKRLKMDS
jgi:hypothetical protein